MTNTRSFKSWKYSMLIPVAGILLFVILYIMAATQYPGGSQFDKNAAGFSWVNNYWCNLLNKYAVNGQMNPARTLAIVAMLVLCVSLAAFWYLFPLLSGYKTKSRILMQGSGIIAMSIAFFTFTDLHDSLINIASFFGLIAFVGTFAGLFQLRWSGLLAWGIFNILLVALNNYLYYSRDLIYYLPVVQKFSFASFLGWFSAISLNFYSYKSRKKF